MSDINDLVLTELLGIRIVPSASHDIGPNAKVEEPNLGCPPPPKRDPAENPTFPDYEGGKDPDPTPTENYTSNNLSNLATGTAAGEALRKAIQSHQLKSK